MATDEDFDFKDNDFSTKDRSVMDFASYEDFLDSLVTKHDRFYLEDRGMMRKAMELGHNQTRTTYTLEAFTQAKQEVMDRLINKRSTYKKPEVISAGRDFSHNILLRMLQQREEANITGKQSSIIMIRDFNEHGHEISGYIDFSHRLHTDDFRLIFDETKRLLPRKGDLSFMNWAKFQVFGHSSPNYELLTTSSASMKFRNKRDNKIMNVDPMVKNCGENTSRTVIPAEDYKHVIIFDHYNRKKC